MSATENERPVDFDLTCWYINQRRLTEIIGPGIISAYAKQINSLYPDEYRRKQVWLSVFKKDVSRWIVDKKVPTLGEMVARDELREGSFFTHHSNWMFVGLNKVSKALSKGTTPLPMANAYCDLGKIRSRLKVTMDFHCEHLTSDSSWSELKGQRRMLVFGLIQSIGNEEVRVVPYVIANPAPSIFTTQSEIGKHWTSYQEVFATELDSFSEARNITTRFKKSDLELLRNISEHDIKTAFSEIIGEPSVPKDWGGERSDLFSDMVQKDGKRISTAFIFKGPGSFKPMTMDVLGKNGDQIYRLFTEPAQLLILQHCHEITVPVKAHMQAFAQRFHDLRMFCTINGYETLQILKAYKKCGLS